MEKSSILFQKSVGFVKGKYRDLFLIMIIPFLVAIIIRICAALITLVPETKGVSFIIFALVAALILALFNIGQALLTYTTPFIFINYLKTRHEQKDITIINSYKIGWKKFGLGLVLRFVVLIYVSIGLLLFIAPGVFLIIVFSFASYAFIVKNKGVRDSLAYSMCLIENRKLEVVKKTLYGLVQFLIPGITALISASVLAVSVVFFLKENKTGMIALGVLGLIGFVYFMIISIKRMLILQDYTYGVFSEFDRTHESISDEKVQEYRKKIKKIMSTITLILLVIIVIIGLIFFL